MSSHPTPGVFAFETFMERTLEYMPMSVRMKLDLCGLKLSLVQWCGLPLAVRQTVLDMDCEAPHEILRMREYLEASADAFQLGHLAPLHCDPHAWGAQSRVPSELVSAMNAQGLPPPGKEAWSGLSNLQRFALIKLTRAGRVRKLQAALEEFGLHRERPPSTMQELLEAASFPDFEFGVSNGRFAVPKDGTEVRESQVFAYLAKGLGEGPHREFAREIDRGDAEA